ncbi:MAG: hypothetical protein ACFB2W_28160, partial [Leptolyngbyaceae cyanobacterium]
GSCSVGGGCGSVVFCIAVIGGIGGFGSIVVAFGGICGYGGNGGFGGGGGAGGFGGDGGKSGSLGLPGKGGFGGGDGDIGYSGGGGGFGGAIFIRSGRLMLYQASFERNVAISGAGASSGQGKGGAIFMTPSLSPQLMTETPSKLSEPTVLVVGDPPKFMDNVASDSVGLPADNNDVFGLLERNDRQ